MGDLAEGSDAGEEVDQYGTNRRPSSDPSKDMNKSCRIAAQLTGSNVAKIERFMPACRELVEDLQAQPRTSRHQTDLTFAIDDDEIKTVRELKLHLGIGIGPATNEITKARLADEGIFGDKELHVARNPLSTAANEPRR